VPKLFALLLYCDSHTTLKKSRITFTVKFLFVFNGSEQAFEGKIMTQQESISESLIESATRVLLRVAFAFEPLAPTAITVLMNQQLHRFKNAGQIGEYKTRAKRIGKFHYLIEVDLDVTGMQAIHLLSNVFPNRLSMFRRWFHD
jgi:hypothetical protein